MRRSKPDVHAGDDGRSLRGPPGPLLRIFKDPRVLFVLVGGFNTVFSTALFAALVLALGPDVPASVSVLIAWTVSLVCVFFVYRRLVFRVNGHVWRDLMRFAGVNSVSLLANLGLITWLVDVSGMPAIPTQIGITCAIVAFNYLAHKHFSFRRRKASATEEDGR